MPPIDNYFHKKPKEKILFLPSEYVTISLIGIFILVALGGILFISSRTSNDSQNQSMPLASGNTLTNLNQAQPVPVSLPPQAPIGPFLPKATGTPNPSPSASSNPIVDCIGPDGKHFSATKSQCDSFKTAWATPTPSPNSNTNTGSATKSVKLTMSTNQSNNTVSKGSNIVINLNIDTTTGKADGSELHLHFDQTKLAVQSFTAGSFMGTTLSGPTSDNNGGTASIILGSGLTPVSGTGTLATLTFKTLITGSAAVSYDTNTQTTYSGSNNLDSSSGVTITIN